MGMKMPAQPYREGQKIVGEKNPRLLPSGFEFEESDPLTDYVRPSQNFERGGVGPPEIMAEAKYLAAKKSAKGAQGFHAGGDYRAPTDPTSGFKKRSRPVFFVRRTPTEQTTTTTTSGATTPGTATSGTTTSGATTPGTAAAQEPTVYQSRKTTPVDTAQFGTEGSLITAQRASSRRRVRRPLMASQTLGPTGTLGASS